MFNAARKFLSRIASRTGNRRYRMAERCKRVRRACRYGCAALSADDAQSILIDCCRPAGWYPLLLLTVEDTLEQAREMFADHPELPRLVADGCARVDAKWQNFGDELREARRWAIDIAVGYAADRGITLVPIEEAEAPDRGP
jgi:hypothetical protein